MHTSPVVLSIRRQRLAFHLKGLVVSCHPQPGLIPQLTRVNSGAADSMKREKTGPSCNAHHSHNVQACKELSPPFFAWREKVLQTEVLLAAPLFT